MRDSSITESGTEPIGGANQVRVRAYNQRLVLSLVRRHGSLAKSEISRMTGLSAQTATIIMREMEKEGLLLRGEPVRGKVGQPSVPLSLNPHGVLSIGLKIGRRSAELVLVDFLGTVRDRLYKTYRHPMPAELLSFVEQGIETLAESLSPAQRKRIAGIGIAMPFELWNWAEKIGANNHEMDSWREFEFARAVQQTCNIPVYVQNDATSACRAELLFGQGAERSDFLYIFIGIFIGGGVVLNHSVLSGRTANAGAIGSMPVINPDGSASQLIDHASLYELENRLLAAGIDANTLSQSPDDWSAIAPVVQKWVSSSARHLAAAIVSGCSIIDFEAVVIDGAMPQDIRSDLVSATVQEINKLDLQGILSPDVIAGTVGSSARAIGGACLPLQVHYLLDPNVLFKEIDSRAPELC